MFWVHHLALGHKKWDRKNPWSVCKLLEGVPDRLDKVKISGRRPLPCVLPFLSLHIPVPQ